MDREIKVEELTNATEYRAYANRVHLIILDPSKEEVEELKNIEAAKDLKKHMPYSHLETVACPYPKSNVRTILRSQLGTNTDILFIMNGTDEWWQKRILEIIDEELDYFGEHGSSFDRARKQIGVKENEHLIDEGNRSNIQRIVVRENRLLLEEEKEAWELLEKSHTK